MSRFMRYVPTYSKDGTSIIGYQEVHVAKDDEAMILLEKEIAKNQLIKDQDIADEKAKAKAEEDFKELVRMNIMDLQKQVKDLKEILDTLLGNQLGGTENEG